MPQLRNEARATELFVRADKEEEQGNMRSAFRLMLAAAKLGDIGAQVNVGNYYDAGKGVRRNRTAALYWYKRAYRRGDSSAASNIGVLWRNEKQPKRALSWFLRAVQLGDEDANIEIGKHYLFQERDLSRAISFLKRVTPSGWVSEAGLEEAETLLRQARSAQRTTSAKAVASTRKRRASQRRK